MGRALRAEEGGLGLAADHGEGLGAHGLRDLDGGEADAAGGAVDQDRSPGCSFARQMRAP